MRSADRSFPWYLYRYKQVVVPFQETSDSITLWYCLGAMFIPGT